MLGFNLSVGRNRQSFGDADAQAFIAATGLTGTTETTAVRRLVANLKTYGLWSKMKAIYPFVSDTYNLVSYSEKFTNAAWTYRRATIVDDAVASPLGTNTATTFTEDTTTGTHEIGNPSAFSISSSQNVTISIYVKKVGSRDWFAITMYNNSGVDKVGYYNISNGTLGNFDAGITGTITSIGSGWYRISATGNFATTGNYFGFKGASANGTISYLGSGALQYNVWGAQLELGSTMTTYQPIATTPANRFVSQFKYNLKDPRDLDAAFRLAFSGTWTYTKQGATPNGVNGYANTYFLESSNATLNSHHISYYSRNNSTGNPLMGASNGTTETNIFPNLSGTFYPRVQATNSGVVSTNFDTAAYFIASRITSTEVVGYRNTSRYAISNTTISLNNLRTYYLGANNDGTVRYNSNQAAFSTIGDGLTDIEATNLYTSVQTFQQDLSRQVGVPIVSDSDAQSFLNAAVITDTTQANAINTLVVGLKNASLWTKMKAIYPFVGGTATTHKWNLKDPRDLDAAYRLAFSGAWTHSSTGALPNGANAYANTYLNPVSNGLTSANSHLSYYARTVATSSDPAEIANFTNNNEAFVLQTKSSVGTNRFFYTLGSAASRVVATAPTGFLSGSAVANTRRDLYLNGVSVANNTTTDNAILGNYNLYLAAGNIGGSTVSSYSNAQSGFASIGNGLTSGEMLSYYNLVQAFQTSLSRQV